MEHEPGVREEQMTSEFAAVLGLTESEVCADVVRYVAFVGWVVLYGIYVVRNTVHV